MNPCIYRYFKLTFLLFLFASNLFIYGQTKLNIVSSLDLSPLPYASITNISKQMVFSADASGRFNLIASKGDTIQVTYVGYQREKLIVNEIKEKNIRLKPVTKELAPVVIAPCKMTRDSIVNSTKNKTNNDFTGFLFGSNNPSGKGKFAVLLHFDQPKALLHAFSFWVDKCFGKTPDTALLNPFIITFFEFDTATHAPGTIIGNKPILYFPRKGGKQTLVLDSLHIHIPESGIYIGFQPIIEEKYRWELNTKNSIGNDSTEVFYGGRMVGEVTEGATYLAFFDLVNDIWKKPLYTNKQLKYEAKIEFCID